MTAYDLPHAPKPASRSATVQVAVIAVLPRRCASSATAG